MSETKNRRLPAFGRQIRDNLNAGRMPALGGNTVAVCIDWPARCSLAHVVCPRDDRPANGWDFNFLAGVETIVWFDRQDRGYAEEVRRELLKSGCPIAYMLQLPDDEQ
jgi:hypothetical protein